MQSIKITRPSPVLPRALRERIPVRLTEAIERLPCSFAEEIRIHSERFCTVSASFKNYNTGILLSAEELSGTLEKMCNGSRYAYHESINQGYLALDGGIRVGICGSAATEKGKIIGINDVSGLIVRLPQKRTVDASPILSLLRAERQLRGILIYAPPGVGKTTLLRSIALAASEPENGKRTVVVDSRCEMVGTLSGKNHLLDLLVGYPKELGIGIAVRSLGAELILCDEIGSTSDALAILTAANCGVPLIATAHAASCAELLSRPSIRRLHEAGVFGYYVGITRSTLGVFHYCTTEAATAFFSDAVEKKERQ